MVYLSILESEVQKVLYKAFADYAAEEMRIKGVNFNPLKAYHICSKVRLFIHSPITTVQFRQI